MKLELEARDATLVLQSEDGSWWHVALQLPDRVVVLGAETRKNLTARLINGLGDALAGTIAGAVAGVPVRCILPLAEEHSTVYAADVAEGRRLLFQDRDAKWIAAMTLSPEERRRWLSLLQRA